MKLNSNILFFDTPSQAQHACHDAKRWTAGKPRQPHWYYSTMIINGLYAVCRNIVDREGIQVNATYLCADRRYRLRNNCSFENANLKETKL